MELGHSTAQHGTAKHSTAQHSTAQHSELPALRQSGSRRGAAIPHSAAAGAPPRSTPRRSAPIVPTSPALAHSLSAIKRKTSRNERKKKIIMHKDIPRREKKKKTKIKIKPTHSDTGFILRCTTLREHTSPDGPLLSAPHPPP